ncbi:MAG TPA: hypothetical protein ENI94_07190 [Gammaproteobacteria bacterium]|nr:hypothetical protein [Gammaproteobacteria bacterium]
MIDLLERLKDDDKEYVRRSVANNLNDIAKDHSDAVIGIAEQWMKGASKERRKITARVFYPGMQAVEVVVNGISVAVANFRLLMP